MTKEERNRLLARATQLNSELYPAGDKPAPTGRAAAVIREAYYKVLGEYADRLPRVRMSTCPLTGAALTRAFDPWGLDGPWWQDDCEVEFDEPPAPPTMKVLQGAVAFHGREPKEVTEMVQPGPEVPFVIPRLMELPGMVAVISQLKLENGDTAYPIGYFSKEDILPQLLHQNWLQVEYWFKLDDGEPAWLIANDKWDFDLAPWIEKGKLFWINPGDAEWRVQSRESKVKCPYLDLPGERVPQSIAWGERELLDLPDGTEVNPYED